MRDLVLLASVLLVLSVALPTPPLTQAQVRPQGDSSLSQTQQMLRDRNLRKTALEQSAEAQQVDSTVTSLMGSNEKADKLYDVSADIFGDIANGAGNDPSKIEAILKRAQQDPEAFYNSLSTEQKARVRDLANEAAPPTPVNR